ncbi:MAG: fatty acyl-AMP ligase [Deltaproteobacteria bacterium]|jgi:acyl-CoA synthetase (AMP-forming)/AMP-acid ligase II|nr:fatty acyl-AMP ligase [Deltaproteobacteria bacterium]MBW2535477.1 fatty acyl-AMP ligase [Deltaproteobacteria bacterium]
MRTVVEALERAAREGEAGYRFIDSSGKSDRYFTFPDMERETARYGGALQELGLAKGDRVALILPDNADFVFAFLGAVRAGIIPVPLYPPPGLRRLEGYLNNTQHIVNKSGARMVLTDGMVKKLLGTVQAEAPALEQVVAVEPIRTADAPFRPETISLDDVCFLQFTSGSTAAPKGVILKHGNLAYNDHAIMVDGIHVTEGVDHGVSWLPLYHDMGLIGFVIAPLQHLNYVTFIPPMLFLRRPAIWLQTISRYGGTVSFGPNFSYALCVKRIKDHEIEGLDLSSWRVAGCGAEPIRAENLHAFSQRFADIGFDAGAMMPCFGMAESTLAVSFVKTGTGVRSDYVDSDELASAGRAAPVAENHEHALPVVCCGKAFPGHEIAIFAPEDDESNEPLPERQVGEIRLRGPSVTSGYFDDPDLSAQAFAGGWLRTGDLGYLADDELYVCGRSKELIIINGRNYYPQDIEWEASQVDGVRKGNVIAFACHQSRDDREGLVIAFETGVTDADRRQALLAEVKKAVQQASGLVLDDVVALDAGVLPKTSSGKLKRAETKQLYQRGALESQTSIRKADPVGAAKELAKSQLGYLRHALFGRRHKG